MFPVPGGMSMTKKSSAPHSVATTCVVGVRVGVWGFELGLGLGLGSGDHLLDDFGDRLPPHHRSARRHGRETLDEPKRHPDDTLRRGHGEKHPAVFD